MDHLDPVAHVEEPPDAREEEKGRADEHFPSGFPRLQREGKGRSQPQRGAQIDSTGLRHVGSRAAHAVFPAPVPERAASRPGLPANILPETIARPPKPPRTRSTASASESAAPPSA